MVEHAGLRNLGVYFHRLFALPRPGGRLLNNGIVPARPGRMRTPTRIRRRSFIDHSVFPDCERHELGAVADVGLGVRGAPRGGYARALRADASGVVRNLEQSWDVAVLEAGEAPARI